VTLRHQRLELPTSTIYRKFAMTGQDGSIVALRFISVSAQRQQNQ